MAAGLGKLILLIYILCYSAGLVGLLASVLSALARRGTLAGLPDRRFAFLSLSFTGIVIPYSILAYLETVGPIPPVAGMTIFSVSLAGDVGLILALPHFMDGFLSPPRGFRDEIPWIGVAAAAAAAAIAFIASPLRMYPVSYITFGGMLASIIQVLVRGPRTLAALRAAAPDDPDAGRWARTLSGFFILTAAAVVPMVLVDFFPIYFVWRIPGFPDALRVFPLLYGGINLIYTAASLKPLLEGARGRATSAEHLQRAALESGLSRRESEVAALLAEGASYKEICARLRISIGTAQSHVIRVYRKLGVESKEELMRLARGEGRRHA